MTAFWDVRKYKKSALAFILILIATTVISVPQLHYSIWGIDEQWIVRHSAGFLDFNMNPGWFGYHTLPMYLLWSVYLVIYWLYVLLGIVGTKQEFVSLLFSDHAVFYVTGRLLFTGAYMTGCYVLALIIKRRSGSFLIGLASFLALIALPDAFSAATRMRVDTFVFLFLTLTIYFSCFSEKSHRNLILSIACCAAAVASKVPAIVFVPLLFIKLLHDIHYGDYDKQCILYFVFLFPLFLFLFLPYAVLDFDSYKPVIGRTLNRAQGGFIHVGKLHRELMSERFLAPWIEIVAKTGLVSLIMTAVLGVLSVRKNRDIFFAILFPLAYVAEFSTSATLDVYWLRPAYPFFVFFTILLLIEAGNWLSLATGVMQESEPIGPIDKQHKPVVPFVTAIILAYCVLTIYNHNYFNRYWMAAGDDRVDNRIIASDWIKRNLPPNSNIILVGFISHYLPNVYTQDKVFTLSNFYYPHVKRSEIVSSGYDFYYSSHADDDRGFNARIINAKRLDYDMAAMDFPRDAYYLVISSSVYRRYFRSIPEPPGTETLFKNARNFYRYIQEQELVKTFKGKGPKIDIYRMN